MLATVACFVWHCFVAFDAIRYALNALLGLVDEFLGLL